jgi:hypothetical protein
VRTYGRVYAVDGSYKWTEIDTASDGSNDAVWLTTLIQCLLLNLGESPFYANYGIPAHPSIVQQVFPDFYVYRTQQQFAVYFASLIIAKDVSSTPTYEVNVTLNNGVKIQASVPI